jgi:RNA polymerase-binding transcription factor DksA
MPPRIPIKKVEPPKRHVIVKGESKDGITATKDFDMKFLLSQRELLNDERIKLVGQATRLENEANAMIADAEMGDVQFDDEGGEGDTMVVEREQDLTLSAFARQTVEEIDAALARMKIGEYGYSSVSGSPIPRERLKALPWATELVTERAGGLGRR